MRRYGTPPKKEISYQFRPGAYAIILRGRDILLTHQAAPSSEFQLPGGGIDQGEHPIPALHREVFEETGWKIAQIRRLGAYRKFTFMPEYGFYAEKLCSIYVANAVCRLSDPSEAGHTAVWTTVDQAKMMLASTGDQAFLSSFF